MFELIVGATALAGAAMAGMVGFGIGSLLTPVLALEKSMNVAVAAIGLPHIAGSLQRFWTLRRDIDRGILLGFGVTSAAGALAGALLLPRLPSRLLAIVFGALLLMAAAAELSGWLERIRWGRRAAWIAGAVSGGFGGLVGEQGGLRAAAMLGFGVRKETFVATSAAIALIVDAARVPVYLATQWRELADLWPLITIATLSVIAGTAIGTRVLGRIPRRAFRGVVAALLLPFAAYMVLAGGR